VLAVAAVLAAVLLRQALVPLFGYQTPYATTYPVMVIVAVLLGVGPGSTASLVAIALTETWLVEPRGELKLHPAYILRMLMLFCPAVYLGYVGQRLRAARAQAQAEAEAARTAIYALRASEERFRAIAENSSQLICMVDAVGRYAYASESFRAIMGHDPVAMIGQSALALVHPDDVAEVSKYPLGGQFSFRMRDGAGNYHWIEGFSKRLGFNGESYVLASGRDVTERRRAEEARQVSEQRYRLVGELIPFGVWETDLEGNAIYLSPLFLGMTGQTLEEHRAGWQERLHPDDTRPTADAWQQCVATGSMWECEFRIRGKDGEYRSILARGLPVCDPAGRISGYVGINFDISERKQAEEALRESEKRLAAELSAAQQLQHISTQLLHTHDLETLYEHILDTAVSILHADFASIQMLDPQRGELRLLGNRGFNSQSAEFWEWVGSNSDSACGLALRTAQRVFVPDVQACDFMAGTKDLEAYLQTGIRAVQTTPLFARSGALLGMLSTHWREPHEPTESEMRRLDVLARLAADLIDRKQTDDALRESERQFRIMGETVPYGVWLCAPDGGVRYCSQSFLDLLDMTHEEQRQFGWTRRLVPEDVEPMMKRWLACCATGTPWEYEHRIVDRHGKVHTILSKGLPVRDAAGKITCWTGVNLDITERKQAEEALAMAKAEAERANAAKDQFLATLSHELRTPLTPMLMLSQLLSDEPDLPESVREDLKALRQCVLLEARLIDDLLDLTRIARGKIQLKPEIVDVHELLKHAAQTCCDEEFSRKRLKLEWDLRAETRTVWADAPRLEQVFWNLIRNAIKFTPENGRVTLRTFNHEGGRLCVEVMDTGIGIQPDRLTAIFIPFEQNGIETTRQFGGLGLGLAISKAIMDLHKGHIEALSAGRGQGATFRVTLAIAAGVEDDAADTPETPVMQEAGRGGRVRILLVEDHRPTAMVLQRLMYRWGWEVEWADSAKAGMELATRQSFQFVVSDLGLPDGSGHDLMRHLRETYGLSGIAVSGYGMDEDVQKSLSVGFVGHITKPIDFEELRKAVSGFLAATTEGQSSSGIHSSQS
jgi:PAS domain S-box-containing protein